LFSTQNGQRQLRELQTPKPLAIIRTDFSGEVIRKARSLSRKYPGVVYHLQNAVNQDKGEVKGDILSTYFDAVDLWVEGWEFCYYVLDEIANGENRSRWNYGTKETLRLAAEAETDRLRAIIEAEIERFAAELADAHPLVLKDPASINPLAAILRVDPTVLDGHETHKDLEVLRQALGKHRDRLLQQEKEQPNGAEPTRKEETSLKENTQQECFRSQQMQTIPNKGYTIASPQDFRLQPYPTTCVHLATGIESGRPQVTLMGTPAPSMCLLCHNLRISNLESSSFFS
jgi:hypothetical protein